MHVPNVLNLTFDDGPDERWTAAVLQELHNAEARASFFVVGEQAQAAPACIRAVLSHGHDVQLHCDRHVRHTELSEHEIEHDTRQALAALASLGVHPTHWRTPWGVRTAATERVARRHRLQLTHWSIDTHDWRGDSSSSMLSHARTRLGDGAVVLMHDALGPGALRTGCHNTVGLLAPLIAAARAAGLEPCSLTQAR